MKRIRELIGGIRVQYIDGIKKICTKITVTSDIIVIVLRVKSEVSEYFWFRKEDCKMRKMKVLLAKCSNVALSLMAVMAMIFANSLCRGRLYEPELPEELK